MKVGISKTDYKADRKKTKTKAKGGGCYPLGCTKLDNV